MARPSKPGSYVARVRALTPLARRLDKAAERLGGTAAEQEFKQAARLAEGQPTPEHLDRLQKAIRALSGGARAQAVHAEAEKEFKLALGAIAHDFTRA